MPHLKAIIINLRDVVAHQGPIDQNIYTKLGRLISFLNGRSITPVFLGNTPWVVQSSGGRSIDLRQRITAEWGEFPWYVAQQDKNPPKPLKAATAFVLEKHHWERSQVIHLGNTDMDMKTARNGGMLFINAEWHESANQYGFDFSSPKEVARFIDIFCIREHVWYFKIEDENLRFYSLGSFSKMVDSLARYSEDAKLVAKFGLGNVDFWTQYVVATLYISGLTNHFKYATAYPGHSIGQKPSIVSDAMVRLTNCLQKEYLPDLIVRHDPAP